MACPSRRGDVDDHRRRRRCRIYRGGLRAWPRREEKIVHIPEDGSPGHILRELPLECIRPRSRHRVYDEVHRLISSVYVPGVNAPVLVHDITTSTANAHGWLTIMGGLPSWLSTGNQVTLLTDNAAAWGQLTRDVIAASQVLHMSQLQFELNYMFTEFIPDPVTMLVPTTGRRLEDEFLKAATARGMEVKISINDFLIGYPADMEGRVRRLFRDTPGRGARLQTPSPPRVPCTRSSRLSIGTRRTRSDRG